MANILVVEDDPQVRALLTESLRLEGYRVTAAADGVEALNAYGQSPPDLVITDMLMPEKEGLGLITALKRINPKVRIIAISGGGATIQPGCNLELARMFGAAKTFSKPLDMDALLKEAAALLAGGNAT